eukprot:3649360-Prymnesium_polylepis.2
MQERRESWSQSGVRARCVAQLRKLTITHLRSPRPNSGARPPSKEEVHVARLAVVTTTVVDGVIGCPRRSAARVRVHVRRRYGPVVRPSDVRLAWRELVVEHRFVVLHCANERISAKCVAGRMCVSLRSVRAAVSHTHIAPRRWQRCERQTPNKRCAVRWRNTCARRRAACETVRRAACETGAARARTLDGRADNRRVLPH